MYKVYKVVGLDEHGSYRSVTAWALLPDMILKYKIGKKVEAPKGTDGIYCFRDRRCARAFAYKMCPLGSVMMKGGKTAILKCYTGYKPECMRSIIAPVWLHSAHNLLLSRGVKVIGQAAEMPFSFHYTNREPAPSGTFVVPSLKPVKRVEVV
jgi:hypothetical protein